MSQLHVLAQAPNPFADFPLVLVISIVAAAIVFLSFVLLLVNRYKRCPSNRVLVIYGSGHLGWLRQNAIADPSVKLRKLSEFAK